MYIPVDTQRMEGQTALLMSKSQQHRHGVDKPTRTILSEKSQRHKKEQSRRCGWEFEKTSRWEIAIAEGPKEAFRCRFYGSTPWTEDGVTNNRTGLSI